MATHITEEQELYIRAMLHDMELNTSYNTVSSYGANQTLYPDNVMSFTDKHLSYIKSHPNLDPEQYLSNLRLKIKKRG